MREQPASQARLISSATAQPAVGLASVTAWNHWFTESLRPPFDIGARQGGKRLLGPIGLRGIYRICAVSATPFLHLVSSDILVGLWILSAIKHDMARTSWCHTDQLSVPLPVGHVVSGFASPEDGLQIPLVCGIGRQQRFSSSLAPACRVIPPIAQERACRIRIDILT